MKSPLQDFSDIHLPKDAPTKAGHLLRFPIFVSGRSRLEGLTLKEMEGYLNHHLKIAGVKGQLFTEEAILAIQQGSGGSLRTANHLARGALVAAALEKNHTVSAEHVRAASTDII